MATKYKYSLDELNLKFHFFGTSVGEWYADADFDAVKKRMERGGLNFSIYYVPVNVREPYEIRQFAPQVPGAKFLGHWEMVVPAKKSAA